MTAVGQQAVYRLGASRYMQAIVTKIVSGDTVELVAFQDGAAWGDGDGTNIAAKLYDSVALGTGVGEWQPGTLVSAAITAATTDLATYSYVDSETASLCEVPGAGSSQVSLGLNAARRPSTTRPVQVNATGQISLTSTLLGAKAAAVSLLSDASNPPTTSRGTQPFNLSGVVATVAPPWSLTYDVPPGHYYMLATSGTDAGGVSLSTITEQPR